MLKRILKKKKKKIEGNALDACNASDAFNATITKQEDLNELVQIEDVEFQKNHGKGQKALKFTSGNPEKRLTTR